MNIDYQSEINEVTTSLVITALDMGMEVHLSVLIAGVAHVLKERHGGSITDYVPQVSEYFKGLL